MPQPDLDAFVWRAIGIVSALLIGFVLLVLHIRRRWSMLPVRVVTSVALVLAFLMSPVLVDGLIMGGKPADQIIDAGWLSLWLPAALMVLAGAAYSLLSKRGARGE